MKESRQLEILRIIAAQNVETQEQLLTCLKASGIKATQATISRDIKDLHLIKEPVGDGTYRYAAAGHSDVRSHNHNGRLRNIFKEGVISFDVAQNIIVVKTMSGLGSAAGAALDRIENAGIVGSIAGDDTVLLIMRSNQAADEFLDEIQAMLE